MAKLTREQRTTYALAVGILLFSVALLLWRYQGRDIVLFGQELSWPWLSGLYEFFGWLSLAGSVVAIAAVFIRRIEEWLKDFLTKSPTSRPQAGCQVAMVIVGLWLYVLSWTEGLRAVSGDEMISDVLFWIGLAWLCILAMPIIKLRPAFRLLLKGRK